MNEMKRFFVRKKNMIFGMTLLLTAEKWFLFGPNSLDLTLFLCWKRDSCYDFVNFHARWWWCGDGQLRSECLPFVSLVDFYATGFVCGEGVATPFTHFDSLDFLFVQKCSFSLRTLLVLSFVRMRHTLFSSDVSFHPSVTNTNAQWNKRYAHTLSTLVYDTFDHVYKNGLRCVACSNINTNPQLWNEVRKMWFQEVIVARWN